jgi:voltage-gated potassium channel
MGLRRRITFALMLLLAVGTVAAAGYRLLGGPAVTLLQAVYMAVITLSGVGYSEVVDTSHNPALRIFNIFVVVFGVAIAVYVFSVLTAFIVEGELHHLFRRNRMRKQINELRNHYIVCGLGETGRHVAEELHKTGTEYVAIENSPEVINRLREYPGGSYLHMLTVIGDATDENVLQQAGLDRAQGLVTCLASDKDNLVVTVLVRQQNQNTRIVARYKELGFSARMLRAGANSAVSPNQIGGLRLASEVLRPHVVSFLDLMLQEKSHTLRIDQINIGAHSPWLGQTVKQLRLQARYSLMLLAMKGPGESGHAFCFNPPDELTIAQGAVIIVMGDIKDLHRASAEAGTTGG